MPKIQVIVLDSGMKDIAYSKHRLLSAEVQLTHLVTKIKKVMKELTHEKGYKTENSVFIVWREYGISDRGVKNLSVDIRKKFKEKLIKITKRYPNLSIIAGSISTLKKFNISTKGEKIKQLSSFIHKSYLNTMWINSKEDDINDGNKQYEKHRNLSVNLISDAVESTQTFYSRHHSVPLNQLRNTCYVFSSGKCIARHDKVAPFEEPRNVPSTYFQPNNKKGNSSIVEASGVLVGIEICREHIMGVLKRECESTDSAPIVPKIHFILSDSILLEEKEMYGDYVIHVDSFISLSMIQTNTNKSPDEVFEEITVYKTSLYNLSDNLVPVIPIIKDIKHLGKLEIPEQKLD